MPTRFTSLSVKAALVAGSFTVGAITATAISGTTGTFSGLITGSAGIEVTGTATGSALDIRPEAGTGAIRVSGTGGTGSGGTLCLEDRDEAGFSVVTALNGTLTTRIAQSDECLGY